MVVLALVLLGVIIIREAIELSSFALLVLDILDWFIWSVFFDMS